MTWVEVNVDWQASAVRFMWSHHIQLIALQLLTMRNTHRDVAALLWLLGSVQCLGWIGTGKCYFLSMTIWIGLVGDSLCYTTLAAMCLWDIAGIGQLLSLLWGSGSMVGLHLRHLSSFSTSLSGSDNTHRRISKIELREFQAEKNRDSQEDVMCHCCAIWLSSAAFRMNKCVFTSTRTWCTHAKYTTQTERNCCITAGTVMIMTMMMIMITTTTTTTYFYLKLL